MREATITIFILLFHLIHPEASTFCSRSFPSLYPSFTFENVTAQCYNTSQDRHQKACFFLLLFPYLSMASVFFCPVEQKARFSGSVTLFLRAAQRADWL